MSDERNNTYKAFDELLDPKGPVILVGQQQLKPVSMDPEDKKSVIFPPSYAGSENSSDDDESGDSIYNIDPPYDAKDPLTHKNVCTLDSIPSQANRMEPIFKEDEYRALIPQYAINFSDGKEPTSIFEIGHRIADSAFRGTELRTQIVEAFKKYSKHDASPMAKLAPTSLIFGVWDSRGTGVKVPRLINSIIRAFDVVPQRRSAQYSPPINYSRENLIPDGLSVKPTKYGLAPVPAPLKIGGVQVNGDIRRDFSLNLELLRDLHAPLTADEKESLQTKYESEHPNEPEEARNKGIDEAIRNAQREADLKLQRYILGLALLAFTATQKTHLRQGCQLLPKTDAKWKQFFANGKDDLWTPDVKIDEFAKATAGKFGVEAPQNPTLEFKKDLLKASIEADAKKKTDNKAANVSPLDNLSKLADGLKVGRSGRLNDGPVKKLTEYVATLTDDAIKPTAENIRSALTSEDAPQDKIDRIKQIIEAAKSATSDSEQSSLGVDAQQAEDAQ